MLSNISLENIKMNQNKGMITVYYDGACPKCVKDRYHYERLSGSAGKNVYWFDITVQEKRLSEIGLLDISQTMPKFNLCLTGKLS
jgi:hypothetical protein